MANDENRVILTDEQIAGEILYETYQLFALYGIKRVRMNEIARQCEISRTTLYRFFKSKKQLVKEILLAISYRMESLMEEMENGEIQFKEKITIITEAKLNMIQEMGEEFVKDIMVDDEYRSIFYEFQAKMRDQVTEFYKHEQDNGNISKEYDAEFLFDYFLSLQTLIHNTHLAEHYPDMGELTVALLNISMRGIWTRPKD